MHPRLVEELLQEEVEAVEANPYLLERLTSIDRRGTRIILKTRVGETPYTLALDGPFYDAEPLSLQVVDAEGDPLPGSSWPPGLCYGEHPSLHRPFACLQGLYEYHTHFSHLNNPWDHHRFEARLPTVLAHVLDKGNCR